MSDNDGIIASIIVLAYNDRKYLDACLSSLLDQDMPPNSYEVIFADNLREDWEKNLRVQAEKFKQALAAQKK